MFTGIIETFGTVVRTESSGKNLKLFLECPFTNELKHGQSVSHNGVCLTVETIQGKQYSVTAIEETLQRSTIGDLKAGDLVNLERALKIGDRLDGHFVQGHVDTMAVCTSIEDHAGSKLMKFSIDDSFKTLFVEKGSVCVNGVSLTVVATGAGFFSVAMIPVTLAHTNLGKMQVGMRVNIECDVLGKYIRNLITS